MSERGRSRSAREPTKPSASAYDVAVRYLGPRPRSVREVRQHLRRKRFPAAAVEAAIRRLQSQLYLDDAAFARYWLDQRARFRPKGALALRAELRAKGVDQAVVDEVLAGVERTEADAAWAALGTRILRWRELPEDERRTKVQSFLRQRGFSYETIEEVLARL